MGLVVHRLWLLTQLKSKSQAQHSLVNVSDARPNIGHMFLRISH